MSLAMLSNTPQFSNLMQVDDATRKYIAEFFGDPKTRSFVQESGDIGSALDRMDGSQNADFGTAATTIRPTGGGGFPAAPTPSPITPQPPVTQDVDIPQLKLRPDVQPSPISTVSPGAVNPALTNPVILSKDDWAKQNAPAIPARPTTAFDGMTPKKKALMLAFMGLSKFGAGLAHQQSSYADEFLGKTMDQKAQQEAYDRNLPTYKQNMVDTGYEKYLDQQARISGINREARLTEEQKMAKLRDFYTLAEQAWQSPRFAGNPDSFKRAIQSYGYGLNYDPARIDQIIATPQDAMKPTVEFSKTGGVPVGVRIGNRFYKPADIPGLNNPEVTSLWESENAGYNKARADAMAQAEKMGQMRGRSMAESRAVVISDPRTGKTRVVNLPMAIDMTAGDQWWGGSPDRLDKARQRWALFGDITAAANQLNSALPQKPMDGAAIARIAMAVKEYHGPLDNFIKSKFVAGMNQDEINAAAGLLQARDQIILLPTTVGMQPSDPRVQSLWNALPTPADLSNPQMAQAKIAGFYRAIENISQGFVGEPGTFGVEAQDMPDNMNQQKVRTQQNRKTGEVRQLINGKWVTTKPATGNNVIKSGRIDLGMGKTR